MASDRVKVVLSCPQCGDEYEAEAPRRWLKERDHRGVGRLDINTYFYRGTTENPIYVNCDCQKTLIVSRVENMGEQPSGVEFCSECGVFIDPKIANGDQLCPLCDGGV